MRAPSRHISRVLARLAPAQSTPIPGRYAARSLSFWRVLRMQCGALARLGWSLHRASCDSQQRPEETAASTKIRHSRSMPRTLTRLPLRSRSDSLQEPRCLPVPEKELRSRLTSGTEQVSVLRLRAVGASATHSNDETAGHCSNAVRCGGSSAPSLRQSSRTAGAVPRRALPHHSAVRGRASPSTYDQNARSNSAHSPGCHATLLGSSAEWCTLRSATNIHAANAARVAGIATTHANVSNRECVPAPAPTPTKAATNIRKSSPGKSALKRHSLPRTSWAPSITTPPRF